MFFLILKRYLISLVGYVSMAIALWLLALWFTDGLLPVLAFTAIILAVIFTVPYKMYVDYTEIRDQTIAILSRRTADAPYLDDLKDLVAEKTGIPAPLVTFLANRSKAFVSVVVNKARTQRNPA
jgi:hypothetical protein